MVGELVKKPEHEPKAYSVMPFVWSIGTIIGPAVGGTFAKPVKNFPSVFPPGCLFDAFPWLLPNLICAVCMLVSIVAGYFWLEETHPDRRPGADPMKFRDIAEQTPIITAAGANAAPGVDLRQESYGTFNEVDVQPNTKWQVNVHGSQRSFPLSEKPSSKCFSWRISMLVVALGIFTYHSMSYDHLLPIFLQDDRLGGVPALATSPFDVPGGLGLSTKTVGLIMSVNGIIALFIQAVVFPLLADTLGVWKVFVLVTLLHPIAYFIVPYLSMLPESLLYPGIYACLTFRNFCGILAYPVILILLKQASPGPNFLGTINGLAASVGAACRTVAPPVSGLLYGWGADIGFTGLAWWGGGFIALVGTAQLYTIPRQKNDYTTVRSAAPCLAATQTVEVPRDVVNVTVVEDSEEV